MIAEIFYPIFTLTITVLACSIQKNCLGALHPCLHKSITLDPWKLTAPPDPQLQSFLASSKTDVSLFFLYYPLAEKQKISLLSRNLALQTFGKLLIVLSTKVNLLYFLYSTVQSCCLLHPIKQNCWLKPFLRTLILLTWVSLYLFSLLELI